jgi:hypothetical protein
MGNVIAISNLTKRRAYLAGEIDVTARRLEAQRAELVKIDDVLRLLDENVNPSAIKGIRHYSRLDGFKQGDLTRLSFTVLRHATEPMSAILIAERIAAMKGVERSGALLYKVRQNLVRLGREGRLMRSGVHRARLWALAGMSLS